MAVLTLSLIGIEQGAIFFAESDFGAHAICLVTSADGDSVNARVITTQLDLEFDAKTGIGNGKDGDFPCKVVSRRELPKDIYETLLGIDRKYRLRNAPEGSKLLEHERKALLFHCFN
jgi:hypothetical protein